MFGIPEHEEWRRYRQMWYRWGKHYPWQGTPLKRKANATARAGRRAQLAVPHRLADMQHPRWARKVA